MIKFNGREVEFIKFPNGEIQIKTESLRNLDEVVKNPHIAFKYEDDSDLIKLMFVKKYLNSRAVKMASTFSSYREMLVKKLIVYYMPYSRMDRSENGSPFTLKYIADFINGLGFDQVEIIEPHSDVTCALIKNSEARYINFDLLPKVMEEVEFHHDDYVMFPDLGASKRYKDMITTNNVIIGHKVRNFQTGDIEGLDLIWNNTNQGSTVIIVDDLSSYGGTFVHSAKKLRAEGFKNIYLLVAHAENSIFKGELFDHVDAVFTTDSLLTEHANWENKKFEHKLRVFEIEKCLFGGMK